MNRALTILVLAFGSMTIAAQDNIADELKALSEAEQYDKVIKYAARSADYSAKALYYIGEAYYMSDDDQNCIKYMDLSIAKDASDPAPHFIRSSTLNYMGRFDEAVKGFQKAISLESDNANSYSGLGDSYYQQQKLDLALVAYTNATEQSDCPGRPYSMIAQIHTDRGDNDKALEAFYTARSKVSKEPDAYMNALYNIGLLESLNGEHDRAEPAFKELLELDPTDYHTYAKLIQVYYHRKDYDKAKPYKDKLYEAHKRGELKDNLEDMFCFDQFKWNDHLVQVFERYEDENEGDIYDKHRFYVVDSAGKIVLRVQTEFSPISVELGGPKYLLCANKGGTHYNPGVGFNDDLKYDDLKGAAIKLIEKHMVQ